METLDPQNLQTLEERLSQDRRMRSVLIAMQCLMYGAAMNWQPSVSSGKRTGGDCPPGESQPLHMIWQHAYVLAAPQDRETVIAQATDALIEARVRTAPIPQGESRQEWEERLIKDGEGWPAREVAVRFLTATREVTKLRIRYERDPHMGKALEQQASIPEMIARGLSARQIAFVTGKKPSTIQYHVNKHKQAA
jgi:hypothetical protein